ALDSVQLFKANVSATEDIPTADLSALHGKDQSRCDVAHVDEIQDEIEIELKALAEETREHGRWRRKVMVMRSDRHGRAGNDDRKPRGGGFHRQSLGEQFRA